MRRFAVLLPRLTVFLVFVVWRVVLANIRAATAVLSPLRRLKPGIVAVPLDLKSAGGIAMLANLITLAPGTLSLDVSADGRFLYVHAMDVGNPALVRRRIKLDLEKPLRELLR